MWYNLAQDTGKISFIKKIELDSGRSKVFSKNRKLKEQGGSDGFCKIQKVMPIIMGTKRNHGKRQSYITITFRMFFSNYTKMHGLMDGKYYR